MFGEKWDKWMLWKRKGILVKGNLLIKQDYEVSSGSF